jgi:HlyD family secretion protein
MTDISFRGPALLGMTALVLLVAGVGTWATQTTLAGAIVVPGQVEVTDNRRIVQHPDGGLVAEVFVRDGQVVAAGDPLVRLDGTDLDSKLRIIDGQLSELAARAARLVAERDGSDTPAFPTALSPGNAAQIDGQMDLFAARRATLANERDLLLRRTDQIHALQDGITAQRTAMETQLALVEDDLSGQLQLFAKGLVAQAPILALRREEARLKGQIGELVANLARTSDQVTEIRIEISRLASKRQEDAASELREIEPIILELTESHRALKSIIDRLVIRAPIEGVVLGLQVTAPKAVLQAAEPVLTLVPQDLPLIVTARILPQDIDAVSLGQPTELAVSAFADLDLPRLSGHVTLVSADVLTDPQSGAAYYTARIALDPGELERLGRRTLLPGMRIDAYLLTGSRTPLAYLLGPFTDYFSRSLRES